MPKKEKIKILFISAEVAPFAKVGGLADVAGALPPALRELGADIRIMMPQYGSITAHNPSLLRRGAIECGGKKYLLKEVIKNFKVEFDGKMEKINVYETALGGSNRSQTPLMRPTPSRGVPVYFIENKKFFGGNKVYDGKDKFLFFSKAAADIVTSLNPDGACPVSTTKRGTSPSSFRVISRSNSRPFAFTPDIIHCNDNHTSMMPVLLNNMSGNFARRDGACSVSTRGKKIKTVLTIHNLEFQGQFSPKDMEKAKLSVKKNKTLAKDSKDGDINKMVQGILLADAVTTVSPTYAKEILTKEYGEGLENILKMRKKDLYGMLNGIDTEKFNPETDPFIKYNYSAKNLAGKVKCKEELIGEYFGGSSPPAPGAFRAHGANSPIHPLIGLVSRLAPQKGIDLVIEAIPKLFKARPEALFILLGTGLPEYEKQLKELGSIYPSNFRPLILFDIKIAQQIYAASDIFLMPSKFEPCGLGQLIAMRYGSVPVARKTGGLADTIEQFKVQSSKFKVNANGFLFEKYSSYAMLKCLDEALRLYRDKKAWKKIVLNGMKRDSSWVKSAKEYMKIYKKLSGKSLRDKK